MKRPLITLLTFFCGTLLLFAQNIPQNMEYTRLYSFIDELATDGLVDVNSAIKPYNRNAIAAMLKQAKAQDSLLNKRQKKDLAFFMSDFANELDTMPKAYVHWTDKKSFDLSLLQPQFLYQNKYFKFHLRPILGMDLLYNRHGLIMKRRWGFDVQMDIVKHVSVWGSLRDISLDGRQLSDEYYANIYEKIDAAKITKPQYLYNLPGYQYKEANYGGDYSDFRGGIKAYAWWGSIGLVKDQLAWGDSYNCSNIISGRAPSFPMITLQLTPCKWFEFNYIHGWMVSNVLDSTYFYTEETYTTTESKKHYRPMNKFIAANMFTFTPIPRLKLSIGNSIIYAERNIQPMFLIPFAFFKSLDHLMTKGVGSENQNSQIFINLSSRNIKHLHLFASFFIDEFATKRLSNAEHNLISYKAGFEVSNWPLKNLSYGFEFTRTNTLNYKHSIQAITWASNSYNLGHYLGDNTQQFFAFINYKPVKGLNLNLSYTKDQKGNDYEYVRKNTKQILAQPILKDIVWENDIVSFKALYEVWPNAYATVQVDWNNARGYDIDSPVIEGENRLDANGYLTKFTPSFYQGSNITVTCGLNIGF